MAAFLCIDSNSPILNKFLQCLINTLLNLGAAELEILKSVLLSLLAPVDAEVAAIILLLAHYDLLAQYYQLVVQAIQQGEGAVIALLNQLPLGLLDPTCTDWAGLNESINDFVNNEIKAPLDQILFEIGRLVSFQGDLQALKAEYEALKQLLSDVIDLIDVLVVEAKCRQAAGQGP